MSQVVFLALLALVLAGPWVAASVLPTDRQRAVAVFVGLNVPLAVLVWPVVAYLAASWRVCGRYERRDFVDCGGVDGSFETWQVALPIWLVLVGVQVLAGALAVKVWRSRRRRLQARTEGG